MASTIKLKNGSGAPLASDLVQGEPALDLTNKRLYTEDSGGDVIEVGTNPTELQVDNINIDGNAITSTDTDGNITITPNGTGEVDISKVDIDSGAIDNTVIGGTTTAAGSFTTLQADTSLNVDGTVTADGLTVDGDSQTTTLKINTASSAWADANADDLIIRGTDIGVTLSSTGTGNLFFGDGTGAQKQGQMKYDHSNDSMQFSTAGSERLRIANNGDISFYEDTGTTAKFFWDASAESLGIGTTSPDQTLHVEKSVAGGGVELLVVNSGANQSGTYSQIGLGTGGDSTGTAYFRLYRDGSGISELGGYTTQTFHTGGTERMRIDSGGNVGIGTDDPLQKLTIDEDGFVALGIRSGDSDIAGVLFGDQSDQSRGSVYYDNSDESMQFRVNNQQEAMRIDSSGNLLVGKTSDVLNTVGATLGAAGYVTGSRSNGTPISANRKSSFGDLIGLYKDGAIVGSIGTTGRPYFAGNNGTTGGGLYFATSILPTDRTGNTSDNTLDLGTSLVRFQDIYATNGTIQTSDRNEKQDIEELSEAEQRVAVAAKGLLRKFRWKSAVEEKGDDARIHFGIIAQDLQAAFEAEGLDAGRYAMFIHSTWTDEETGEERSRMGVRYSELLAFIIAAI